MGRVINADSAGKDRTRAVKVLVLSIRELLKQRESSDLSRDLIACILLNMDKIDETVDLSVEAWEKRGYWIKADHFRMDWQWSKIIADKIRPMVYSEDYGNMIPVLVEVLQSLSHIEISEHHRLGTPWADCWKILQAQKDA